MTPKEKARELVIKYSKKSNNLNQKTTYLYDKECALIAVDEMQLVMSSMWKVAGIDEQYRSTYLEKVKQEIEKL